MAADSFVMPGIWNTPTLVLDSFTFEAVAIMRRAVIELVGRASGKLLVETVDVVERTILASIQVNCRSEVLKMWSN